MREYTKKGKSEGLGVEGKERNERARKDYDKKGKGEGKGVKGKSFWVSHAPLSLRKLACEHDA